MCCLHTASHHLSQAGLQSNQRDYAPALHVTTGASRELRAKESGLSSAVRRAAAGRHFALHEAVFAELPRGAEAKPSNVNEAIIANCLVAAEKDSTNMAKNYLHEGWTIVVPAPTGGVHSGDPILVGGFFGVANYDAEQTLPVEITLGGVWQLPKAAIVTFAVGAAVYFDATAGNVTSVSTRGNKLIGAATQCAGASDAVAIVRLNGVSV
jgi:predicted RecA/RadA family phage recombinase